MTKDSFEFIFNNFNRNTLKKSKKNKTNKTKSKKLNKRKIKEDNKLFNNNKNDFDNLYNFYSTYKYEEITNIYNKLKNIIIDTKGNDEKMMKKNGIILQDFYYII